MFSKFAKCLGGIGIDGGPGAMREAGDIWSQKFAGGAHNYQGDWTTLTGVSTAWECMVPRNLSWVELKGL